MEEISPIKKAFENVKKSVVIQSNHTLSSLTGECGYILEEKKHANTV